MDNLSDNEIELMDEILVINFNEGRSPVNYPDADYSKKLNVPKDTFRFAFNSMCKFGKEFGILKAYQFDDDSYEIVSFEKYNCKKFIDNGGFKRYFEKQITSQATNDKGFSHNIIGDNFQGNTIIYGDKNANQPKIHVDNSKNKGSQNKIGSILTKYWWAFVVPLLVVLAGLAIEYKWFAKK